MDFKTNRTNCKGKHTYEEKRFYLVCTKCGDIKFKPNHVVQEELNKMKEREYDVIR